MSHGSDSISNFQIPLKNGSLAENNGLDKLLALEKAYTMPKAKTKKSLKMNKKTLLKLLSRRESVEKEIQRRQRFLARIDKQISSFAAWLKSPGASN